MASSLLRLEEKQFSKTLVVSRPGLQPPCVSKGDEGWMPLTAEPDFPNLSVTIGHALSEVFSLSPSLPVALLTLHKQWRILTSDDHVESGSGRSKTYNWV